MADCPNFASACLINPWIDSMTDEETTGHIFDHVIKDVGGWKRFNLNFLTLTDYIDQLGQFEEEDILLLKNLQLLIDLGERSKARGIKNNLKSIPSFFDSCLSLFAQIVEAIDSDPQLDDAEVDQLQAFVVLLQMLSEEVRALQKRNFSGPSGAHLRAV